MAFIRIGDTIYHEDEIRSIRPYWDGGVIVEMPRGIDLILRDTRLDQVWTVLNQGSNIPTVTLSDETGEVQYPSDEP